jgi:signal transduction histidine kinase
LAEEYGGTLGPVQARLVARAQRRLASLHALIDDLLDLAAGKADMSPGDRRLVDLGQAVAEIAERYQPIARDRGVALEVRQPAAPIEIWCDAGDLDRIVGNLVSNAVKYTTQGWITVTLSREGDAARLEVKDTGIGIPADALPHLFKEFYRAGNAKVVDESGTGLGLSIVRNVVERYGGRVEVTSQEGVGTTFLVTLPAAVAAAGHLVEAR